MFSQAQPQLYHTPSAKSSLFLSSSPLFKSMACADLDAKKGYGHKMTEFASRETLKSSVFGAQIVLLWNPCDKMQCWAERVYPSTPLVH